MYHENFDPKTTRLRYLGGGSNHWEGWCRPLDGRDFERRDHVADGGWPIAKEDLDIHAERAKAILDNPASKPSRDSPLWSALGGFRDFRDIEFDFSEPVTRFGIKYREAIERSTDIRCYIDANVTDLLLNDRNDAVREPQACSPSP